MSIGELVYRSDSVVGCTVIDERWAPLSRETVIEEYCFICNRSTDHSGEHENGYTEFFESEYNGITHITIYVKLDPAFI